MEENKIIFQNASMNNFLRSIAAFADRVIIEEKDNQLMATTFIDQCIFRGYYKNIKFNKVDENVIKLNIPDVKNLQKIIDNITENDVTFKINGNHIVYNSKNFKTKYFLLEDGIIPTCRLNIDKALNLNWDVSFDLTRDDFSRVLKLTSLSNIENKKLYFYTSENALYCDIGDKISTNTNELTTMLLDNVDFEVSGIIIPAEIIRIINSAPYETMNIKINKEKFLILFSINDIDYTSYFIVAGKEK